MRSPTLGTGLLALVLAAAALAPAAQADPRDPDTPTSSEVQAARERAGAALTDVEAVQQRYDEATAELDAASIAAARAAEAYNGARWRAKEARKASRLADRRSVKANQALVVQKGRYRDTLITTNTAQLELSAINAIIASDGVEALLDRSSSSAHVQALFDQQREDYTVVAAEATDAADAAEAAQEKADAALVEAAAARAAAEAAARAARVTVGRIERRKARLVRRLARLQGISVELAQQRQDALEEERRAVPAAAPAPVPAAAPGPAAAAEPVQDQAPAPDPAPAPQPKPADPPVVVPDNPPSFHPGGAKAAIAYARDQLGEPYVWGASGPSSWDCSGLTSKAWAAGGKSLPHYSVAQYEQSTPISAGQLRPGDLVFWGDNGSPGSIFHVALYTGGGQIIHAPRTGRPVVEESMYYWRAPDFYARP